jgi:hypothetical protein
MYLFKNVHAAHVIGGLFNSKFAFSIAELTQNWIVLQAELGKKGPKSFSLKYNIILINIQKKPQNLFFD